MQFCHSNPWLCKAVVLYDFMGFADGNDEFLLHNRPPQNVVVKPAFFLVWLSRLVIWTGILQVVWFEFPDPG